MYCGLNKEKLRGLFAKEPVTPRLGHVGQRLGRRLRRVGPRSLRHGPRHVAACAPRPHLGLQLLGRWLAERAVLGQTEPRSFSLSGFVFCSKAVILLN